MQLPLTVQFLLRRLRRRPGAMTAIALLSASVMASAMLANALVAGATLDWWSGGPRDSATLMSATAGDDPMQSAIARDAATAVQAAVAIWCRPGPDGPVCSPESLLHAHVMPPPAKSTSTDVAANDASDAPQPADDSRLAELADRTPLARVRGVTSSAWELHPALRITQGRRCREPGELVVGQLAPMRLGLSDSLFAVGARLRLLDREWTVVGRFAAPHDPAEGELWCALDAVRDLRPLSIIRLGLRDVHAVAATGNSEHAAIDRLLAAHPEWNLRVRRDDMPTARDQWNAHATRWLGWFAALLVALAGVAFMGLIWRAITEDYADDIRLLGSVGAGPTMVEWSVFTQAMVPVVGGVALGALLAVALDGLAVMPGGEPVRLLVTGECGVIGLLAVLIAWAVGMWPSMVEARRTAMSSSRV